MPNFYEIIDAESLLRDPINQQETKQKQKNPRRKLKKAPKKKLQRRRPSFQHHEPIEEAE